MWGSQKERILQSEMKLDRTSVYLLNIVTELQRRLSSSLKSAVFCLREAAVALSIKTQNPAGFCLGGNAATSWSNLHHLQDAEKAFSGGGLSLALVILNACLLTPPDSRRAHVIYKGLFEMLQTTFQIQTNLGSNFSMYWLHDLGTGECYLLGKLGLVHSGTNKSNTSIAITGQLRRSSNFLKTILFI